MTEGDYRTKTGDGGRLQGRRAVTEGDYRTKAGDGGRLQDEESRQLLWDGADDKIVSTTTSYVRSANERKGATTTVMPQPLVKDNVKRAERVVGD